MPEYKYWEDLESGGALENYLMPIICEELAKKARLTMQKYLRTLWYDSSPARSDNPTYERTYDMIKSVSVTPPAKSGGYYEAVVHFDDDKISAISPAGGWGAHTSLSNEEVKQGVAWWINYGNNNSIAWAYDGVGYLEKTMEETQQIIKEMINELKGLGIILV